MKDYINVYNIHEILFIYTKKFQISKTQFFSKLSFNTKIIIYIFRFTVAFFYF